ncbi:hypothetical protein XAPC_3382 [Xanthomonas citri pv. punicae str. LMG 859]|nr:hypothetical protein XAPC_3382 [Xanthomonas citri pv. punicae str. LMG 859]
MVAALSCSDKSNAGIADASIRIAAVMRPMHESHRTQPCRAHHHCMPPINCMPGWRQTRHPGQPRSHCICGDRSKQQTTPGRLAGYRASTQWVSHLSVP